MKNLLFATLMVLVGSWSAFADLENLGEHDKVQSTVSVGYNLVETEKSPGRAAEYVYHDDSTTGSFMLSGGTNVTHMIIEGDFLNKNDYAFSGHFDRNKALRLDLRAEKMFHNLDHLDYGSRPNAEFVATDLTDPLNPVITTDTRGIFEDHNPNAVYGLEVGTYEANFRAKLPDMPSHFNIGYWQFHKQGAKQMRYVDENCAAACHVQSRTRNIDRTTHQLTGGFDIHLGKYDLIFKQLYREFSDHEPIPENSFERHSRFRTVADDYQHSEDPESKLYETSIEMHRSLAGGVNVAASGTYGKRKNRSEAVDASPIIAETEYWKGAVDVRHATSAKFSYNFKARYLETAADNNYPQRIDPFVTITPAAGDDDVTVRPPIDLQRSSLEFNSSFRLNRKSTLKGTAKVEQVRRGNTGGAMPFHSDSDRNTAGNQFENDMVWELPDKETIVTAKLGFYSRPGASNRLKVNGFAKAQHSTDPAYGAAFENLYQLFLSSSYAPSPRWGLNASVSATSDNNKGHEHDIIVSEGPTVTTTYELDREREQESFNLGTWFNPTGNITTTLNYGFNRTHIQQDLLYGTSVSFLIPADEVEMLNEAHSVSGTLGFALLGNVKAKIGGHYTRSLYYYDPVFATQTFMYSNLQADVSSDGLKEITHFDIEQFGGNIVFDYYVTPDFELSLKYAYDEYDDKYTDLFDGSVQSTSANLSYRF